MSCYIFPVRIRCVFRNIWQIQRIPIALNQLPYDIDALKSLVSEQVARNEQLQADM
jgi:hypothetical protein